MFVFKQLQIALDASFCYNRDMSGHMHKVAIVLRLSGHSGRSILSGALKYIQLDAQWQTKIYQMPDELTVDVLKMLVSDGYEGLLLSETATQEVARAIAESPLAVALIGVREGALAKRKNRIVFSHNDDIATGRIVARYLYSLGRQRAYGFVPTVSARHWSEGRLTGFADELAKKGEKTVVFRSPGDFNSPEDCSALGDWLEALPKPAAVMASWDGRGLQVLQLCNERKIKVPAQLAVVGVDNDEMLDSSASPQLTSLQPDHEACGYIAARELDRLMNASTRKSKSASNRPEVFISQPIRVVERESARAVAPAASLIQRANEFIRLNATRGIGVADVAKHLGVSRSLLDLRFRQFNGESVNSILVRMRLDAVKRLLATTRRSILSIGEDCGFSNPSYLKTLFRSRFKVSMRDWREANRAK